MLGLDERKRRVIRDEFVHLVDFCCGQHPQIADRLFVEGIQRMAVHHFAYQRNREEFMFGATIILEQVLTLPPYLRRRAVYIAVNTTYDLTDLDRLRRLGGLTPQNLPIFRSML